VRCHCWMTLLGDRINRGPTSKRKPRLITGPRRSRSLLGGSLCAFLIARNQGRNEACAVVDLNPA
jgi:hypothetical protein